MRFQPIRFASNQTQDRPRKVVSLADFRASFPRDLDGARQRMTTSAPYFTTWGVGIPSPAVCRRSATSGWGHSEARVRAWGGGAATGQLTNTRHLGGQGSPGCVLGRNGTEQSASGLPVTQALLCTAWFHLRRCWRTLCSLGTGPSEKRFLFTPSPLNEPQVTEKPFLVPTPTRRELGALRWSGGGGPKTHPTCLPPWETRTRCESAVSEQMGMRESGDRHPSRRMEGTEWTRGPPGHTVGAPRPQLFSTVGSAWVHRGSAPPTGQPQS